MEIDPAGQSASLNVLVVDDDDAVRSVIARSLRLDGHAVVEASTGVLGIQLLDEQRFDLVVTDIVMPDMEGLELVRRIRKRPAPPRIIAISGGGRTGAVDYLELARRLGADCALPKPVGLKDLRAALAATMGAARKPDG